MPVNANVKILVYQEMVLKSIRKLHLYIQKPSSAKLKITKILEEIDLKYRHAYM